MNRESISADVTVVGTGIAGLWTAKELIDRDYDVQLIEKGTMLADGSTTRNEGWLHAGGYHAIAIDDVEDAMSVAERVRYGHDKIVDFAPESIDHKSTYAIISSDIYADRALNRLQHGGIPYREVPKQSVCDSEGIDHSQVQFLLEVEDKSVNSRTLVGKLADYINNKGGRIITNSCFEPIDENHGVLNSQGQFYNVQSERFVITAGVGAYDIFNAGGVNLPMRFFKSHLLVMPRLTTDNLYCIDPGAAGLMNHGEASVVGINRDAVEVASLNYDILPEKERLIYEAVKRLLPNAAQLELGGSRILPVACIKPDVSHDSNVPQSLNEDISEPLPGYICAFPGKMTEAPHLAYQVVNFIEASRPIKSEVSQDIIYVKPRPADLWMEGQALNRVE